MKKISFVIAMLICMTVSTYSQTFYYSNNQKIYLTQDTSYIFVVPSTEINSYFTNVVQPIYSTYFNNYTNSQQRLSTEDVASRIKEIAYDFKFHNILK